MTTDTHRDSGQVDLSSDTASDSQVVPEAGQPDAWTTAAQQDVSPEGQLPPEGGLHSEHQDLDEDPDEGSADARDDDEADLEEKAKRRKRADWIFRIGTAVFVSAVGVGGYLFLKPSAPSGPSAQLADSSIRTPVPAKPQMSPSAANGVTAAAMTPAAVAPAPTPVISPAERQQGESLQGDLEFGGRVEESELGGADFEDGHPNSARTADPRAAFDMVPPAVQGDASPNMQGYATPPSTRDLGGRVDLVATNVVALNRQMEILQERLTAMEGGQTAILAKLSQVADKIPEKTQPAPGAAKAPARAAEPKPARATAAAAGPKRVTSSGEAKAGKLAGLWVKGAYPATGGDTQIAWVMNEQNQLEAAVRVGAVVRGARVTGFDGMKVITTAGTIRPR
ncbi:MULTISPECIES: hypothetical protein [Achromobacter]|uniref:Uncharacterized protein n=1 Tax=Achromobacter mucicolens TaxID=1389922 RepID=A0ABM8LK37_9BURK|nr:MULTISPECIES: hypothetical protein [Achromobacter]AVG43850.1 hypothetical protein MC81_30510 [Achromobacter insolitus]CAB3846354.1 hypothetical protein LMG3410_01537 [Achromobacter aegrifaciens]CAB3913694.1 hypothetical protein LMG3415_05112 [Achromobacter mucicolens]